MLSNENQTCPGGGCHSENNILKCIRNCILRIESFFFTEDNLIICYEFHKHMELLKVEVFYVKKKEKLFLRGEISISELDTDVQKKYEIAKELGIYDKVLEKGWGSLTAEETGRLGGVIGKRKADNSHSQSANDSDL